MNEFEEFFKYWESRLQELQKINPRFSNGSRVKVKRWTGQSGQKKDHTSPDDNTNTQTQQSTQTTTQPSSTPLNSNDYQYGPVQDKKQEDLLYKNYFPKYLTLLNSNLKGVTRQIPFRTNGAQFDTRLESGRFIALDTSGKEHVFYPMINNDIINIENQIENAWKTANGDMSKQSPYLNILFKEDFKATAEGRGQALDGFSKEDLVKLAATINKAIKTVTKDTFSNVLPNWKGNIVLGNARPTQLNESRIKEAEGKTFEENNSVEIPVIINITSMPEEIKALLNSKEDSKEIMEQKEGLENNNLILTKSNIETIRDTLLYNLNKVKNIKTDAGSYNVIFNKGKDEDLKKISDIKGQFTIIVTKQSSKQSAFKKAIGAVGDIKAPSHNNLMKSSF